MSFETLYNRVLKRKDHQYYLLKKEVYTEEIEPQRVLKDEVGNIIPKVDLIASCLKKMRMNIK